MKKGVSKFIKSNGKGLPLLKGSPTIYNSVTSASNYKGFLKAKIPSGLYFNPAQSSPTGSINSETIPLSFLPKDDPRRVINKNIASHDRLQGKFAPPVLCSKSTLRDEGKTYHLNPSNIEEIKKLRIENPDIYTRKVLAKQFKVSPLFISMITEASESRKVEMNRRLDIIKSKWHEKRSIARSDRKKRKELWYTA